MKAICLLSGGMDSTTLAYHAKKVGYGILAIHLSYGQKTEKKELASARIIARLLEAEELLEVDVGYFSLFGGSSLTDHTIEIEEFDELNQEGGVPATYVPFRNGNLLSIATSFAEARCADAIFIGVQAQDYSGYPDCRPEFINAFQKVIDIGTRRETDIRLLTPFVNMTKKEILSLGLDMGVPYEYTWSCYKNDENACGKCSSCHYRKAAFDALGVADPIPYEGE
jgi:7-cyano-7-deazaguanine synthase